MALAEESRGMGVTEAEKGVLYAVLAHLTWGAMAVYFGFLRHVSPMEIAVHRGLWSIPCAALVIWWLGQHRDVLKAISSPRNLAILTLTSGIIVLNWGFYVWSIEVGRTLESSLGYYINPLMNVVMGYLFLGERFNRWQMVALVLAVVAVLIQTFAAGVFPWLGLMLASTFCLYGFLRKTIKVGPTQGFFIEVLIIAAPLMLMQVWLARHGMAKFGGAVSDTALLMGCGLMTSTALIFFAASLKRLRYSTAGLLQYISPSLVFLTAVFIFGEPLDKWRMLSFVIIWIALAIYSYSAIRDEKTRRADLETVP
jgi:chloramphenicol-sensitive protein RarD